MLTLHPGKEKSVLRRHPWLFSGAVARLDGRARPGDTVDVVSHEGRPLGRAAWSPARCDLPPGGTTRPETSAVATQPQGL
jgi:23S rRNA (cytosine1962-C5)-methyltransferase